MEGTSNLRIAQSKFPVQQASIVKLRVVKLSKRVHCHTDFVRDRLKELGIFLIVGPVTLSENLHLKVNFNLFTRVVALELLA